MNGLCEEGKHTISYPALTLTLFSHSIKLESPLNPKQLSLHLFFLSLFQHLSLLQIHFILLVVSSITHIEDITRLEREKIDISENIISKICHEHPLELSHSNSLIRNDFLSLLPPQGDLFSSCDNFFVVKKVFS